MRPIESLKKGAGWQELGLKAWEVWLDGAPERQMPTERVDIVAGAA
jgi:hypothetical protein